MPHTKIEHLYERIDYCSKVDGDFVLALHCYGFDEEMKYYDATIKDKVKDLINYASKKKNIEFVTVNEMFRT